jgi:translocation and assembly module TamB
VELAGDLSLVLNRGQPRVDGQLHAVRGTFSFLGSSFEVDRGVATFYGTESIDPDLDLMLSRRKGDVKAIVRVTGRTTAPAIALSSEPPMEEADVASYLLFGRASTDLDREQTGLLQSQASAALQLYAMPGLQRELGQRLGLDVVQVRQRDDATEQMSVVVGKYLSPRALLKYDQGLDRTDDFTIDLEYWLTRHLRVETTTSRQNQSGVILNWSADY